MISKVWKDWERFYPPGYEWKKERNWTGLFLGIGIGSSALFLVRLEVACRNLYEYSSGRRMALKEGAIANSFMELIQGCFWMLLPLFFYLLAMVGAHYFYYYRDTKSIYLMRRLESKSFLIKSCVMGPLLWAGLGIAAAVLMFWLYFGLYLLAVPTECMPRFI